MIRIVERDAFECEVLECLDIDVPDPEHDRRVDFLFERLLTTDETVMSALRSSAWFVMGGSL